MDCKFETLKKDRIDLRDLRIRDTYIVTDKEAGKYYLYYLEYESGDIDCLESENLTDWYFCSKAVVNGGRFDVNWAPEIHKYQGAYWFFMNRSNTPTEEIVDKRGCYILKSDTPYGPFEEYSGRLTPEDRLCIDGTLYVDDEGVPYMVYVHEWLDFEEREGDMYVVQLTDDLKSTVGEHIKLFHATDNPSADGGITDGPFMYRAKNGDLVMLWSNYLEKENETYAVLVARSQNGILGPWTHDEKPLFANDGGHPMVFEDLEGNLKITFHVPNSPEGAERAVIYDFIDDEGHLKIAVEK